MGGRVSEPEPKRASTRRVQGIPNIETERYSQPSLRDVAFQILAALAKNVRAPPKIATAARALLLPLSYCCRFRTPLHSQSSLVPRSPRLLRSALLLNSLTWGQNGTESKADVPVRRVVVAAVRRPAVDRAVAPTAAPKHTVRAR